MVLAGGQACDRTGGMSASVDGGGGRFARIASLLPDGIRDIDSVGVQADSAIFGGGGKHEREAYSPCGLFLRHILFTPFGNQQSEID